LLYARVRSIIKKRPFQRHPISLRTIHNKRLYQQVADQIAALIRKGHWLPGDRLPAEREIAQRLGVSRLTIREALIALEMSGMIGVKTGTGIYVMDSRTDTRPRIVDKNPGPSPYELMDARRIIEGETAAIAAE
jgi:DNA-binding FadR family transcriptional regulator